ncbi:hypothetical protein IAT38_006661 [Cryptococcus sp. DSM 104549]
MRPEGLKSIKDDAEGRLREAGTGEEIEEDTRLDIEDIEGPAITLSPDNLLLAADIIYKHLPNNLSPHGPQPRRSPVPSMDAGEAQRLMSYFSEVRSLVESLPLGRALFPLTDTLPPPHLAGLQSRLDPLDELDLAQAANPKAFPVAWVEAKKQLIRAGRGHELVSFEPTAHRPSIKRASVESLPGRKMPRRESSLSGSPCASVSSGGREGMFRADGCKELAADEGASFEQTVDMPSEDAEDAETWSDGDDEEGSSFISVAEEGMEAEKVIGQVDPWALDSDDYPREEKPKEIEWGRMIRSMERRGVQICIVTPECLDKMLAEKKRKVLEAAWAWDDLIRRLERAEVSQGA